MLKHHIWICCVVVLISSSLYGLEKHCEENFEPFQDAVTSASDQSRRRFNSHAHVSVLRGDEHRHISYDPAFAHSKHVIYFGSGPDIFRVLRDFPWAHEVHLFDSCTGWSRGPGCMISELGKRIAILHQGSGAPFFNSGFWAHVPKQHYFDPDAFWAERSDSDLKRPAHWDIHYGPPGQTRHVRVWLHVLNYNMPEHMHVALGEFGGNSVSGVLVAGAPLPTDETWAILRPYLDPNAYIVIEKPTQQSSPKWLETLLPKQPSLVALEDFIFYKRSIAITTLVLRPD